jgi:DNA-binding GntR family transcriptional regulator
VRAVDKAYQALSTRIIEGTYPAGARLGEVELAETLGISRTPVREALRRLESQGLVETIPNRGARVRAWNADELAEIFTLRALLEGHAAHRAAGHAEPAEARSLLALCDEMEAAAFGPGEPDYEVVAQRNRDFHSLIVDAARSPLLVELTSSVTLVALVVRTFKGYEREQLRRSMDQHRELAKAIAAGDGTWAEAVMRAHILSATRVASAAMDHVADGLDCLQVTTP